MNPAIAARIPLVCRTKPPGKPLAARIADLTALTIDPAGAGHHDLVARACGVLNISALIASDAGLPGLAADLCWRQHKIFAESGSLDGEIAVMSLMPLINISRLLIRKGDGKAAYEVLDQLYRAAQQRSATVIHGHDVDLTPLIHNRDDHRAVCTELWIALLVDGARALAHQGRWSEAADAMAAHRGIGERLLDGRQLKIMALMEQGLPGEAAAMIDATVPAEPWEHTVAALFAHRLPPARHTYPTGRTGPCRPEGAASDHPTRTDDGGFPGPTWSDRARPDRWPIPVICLPSGRSACRGGFHRRLRRPRRPRPSGDALPHD
ncbi:hypothetical protein [Nonomuraea sp. JJY05]|uniref:hypothetical protein n=1 Tax=Nonomuraea sp. JJY05 TaxID=3350255 RepID=UPI00373E33F1